MKGSLVVCLFCWFKVGGLQRSPHSGCAISRGGNRPLTLTPSSTTNQKASQGLRFFVCLLCGLAHKEQNKQKKHATQSSSVSSDKWELTDSNRRPSACKADALNQLS